MRCLLLIIAWITVVVTAAFLRVDDLSERPMHADEATGARIAAKRMEGQGGEFNPTHYHGPLLADLTIPVCLVRGETGWASMSKTSLRLVTAVAGCLMVLVPLFWRRPLGDLAALAAAALLAVSPLLVYFSRMFIHESLLVLFGGMVMGLCVAFPRWGLPGVALGLMFAAKESVAISGLAWVAAIGLLMIENRSFLDMAQCRGWLASHWRTLAASLATAVLTTLVFYTHGFTHLQGAVDAVRTYFVYETVSGHDKPWDYYLKLLVMPRESAGMWWYGTPLVVLAVLAYAMSWGGGTDHRKRNLIHLLAYSAVIHLVIYSMFAYKTPWLACLPWALVCWLAGLAFSEFGRRARWLQCLLLLILGISLASQWRQARIASGRLDSDARNPYAYVPTRRDVEQMEKWLLKLRDMKGGPGIDTVAVVGGDYWPLPWYLRGFERVGYWPQPPAGIDSLPVVLAMADQMAAIGPLLAETHVPLPRGLRDGVPMQLYISRALWDHWMSTP